ncbi:hypothetical protein Fmac_005866 [Flemingia macrophylla]|uniref:Uncharacterized protein n=1 Tax=Flemingia macrophylla TaxID=520843 RepID=A0ABD1N9I0_9FABA
MFTSDSTHKFLIQALPSHAKPSPKPNIDREYSIAPLNIDTLTLTFKPFDKHPNAFAFFNNIELTPMPDLFDSAPLVGYSNQICNTKSLHLQTMSRLNAVGVTNEATTDFKIDYKTIPQYVAPTNIYTTLQSIGNVKDINIRIQSHMGILGGIGVPTYKNYMIYGKGLRELWVVLHPTLETKQEFFNALFNGVEVFKVNETNFFALVAALSDVVHQRTKKKASSTCTNTSSWLPLYRNSNTTGTKGNKVWHTIIGY